MTGASTSEVSAPEVSSRERWVLTFALVAPGTAWFLHLNASYSLAAYACHPDKLWLLHTWTAAGLVVCAWCLFVSIRTFLRRRGSGTRDGLGAVRFTSVMAALLSALFGLSVLMQGLSNFVLRTCM